MNSRMKDKVVQIFNDSQVSFFSKDNGIARLKELVKPNGLEEEFLIIMDFVNEFNNCLQTLLSLNDNANVHFVKQFVIEYLASLNENNNEKNIQHDVIDFLLKNSRVSSDAIRLRICEILFRFLELVNKNGNGELEEDLIKKMQTYLIERNRDANMEVQKMAIRASSLLQFPRDKFCPIIASFIYLLKHDSIVEIKNLVMNYIAINQLTFNLIKFQLIFDTNPVVSNKALSTIRKKVPCKFIDAKFKRVLIVRLVQNNNMELLEAFVIKWLDDEYVSGSLEEKKDTSSKCLKFISDLDLENIWYRSLEFKELNYVDANLQKVMDFVYKNVTQSLKTLASSLEKIFEQNDKFLSMNHSFFCRSLLNFLISNKKDLELNLSLEQFESDFKENFKNKIQNSLNTFNLIHCFFHFYDLMYLHENVGLLFEWLFSLEFEQSYACIYELIMNRFEKSELKKLVWEAFMSTNLKVTKEIEKFLFVLTLFLAKLSIQDYEEMEMVDFRNLGIDIDLEETDKALLHQNMIDFFVDGLLLTQIASQDPKIRALTVRSIGLASLIHFEFCHEYIELINQITLVDYPQVIVESLKASFNIIMFYPKLNEDWENKNKWEFTFRALEKQMDCSNNNLVRFTALEGFAKLFIAGCWMPNQSACLSKLIQSYISDEKFMSSITESQPNAAIDDSNLAEKLKNCLGKFFEEYIFLNKENLGNIVIKAFIPTLKLAVHQNSANLNKKKLSNFFYYLTFNVKGMRQLLIGKILDEITRDLYDFNLVNRWLEVLLELNIHQLDIDLNQRKELSNLTRIINQLNKLLIHFKQEKWRLPQESEIKNLINSIKLIIRRNEEQNKRKNPGSDPYLEYIGETINQNKSKLAAINKENNNAETNDTQSSNKKTPSTISINKNTLCQDMIKKNRTR